MKNLLTRLLRAIFGPANENERIRLHLEWMLDNAEAAADAKSRRIAQTQLMIDELDSDIDQLIADRDDLRMTASAIERVLDGDVQEIEELPLGADAFALGLALRHNAG